MSTVAANTPAQSTNNAGAAPTETPTTPPAGTPAADAKPAEQTPEVKSLVTDGGEGEGKAPASGDAPNETPAKGDKAIVPEKYDLKLSEKSPLSDEHLQQVAEYAKEKGLSQEQAQELLAREEKSVGSYIQEIHKQHGERVDGWIDAVKADKEIGGDNFKESVHYSNQFVKKFASPELINELRVSGFGNHPEVVRMFARAGRAMANDKLVTKGVETKPVKSTAEVFYPNQTK